MTHAILQGERVDTAWHGLKFSVGDFVREFWGEVGQVQKVNTNRLAQPYLIKWLGHEFLRTFWTRPRRWHSGLSLVWVSPDTKVSPPEPEVLAKFRATRAM